ncbi:MAG TPA: hypothetical protein DCF68_21170, partial [Cyanothece sp. UBA12306]|nr:hypothetical protein [Cyanothece sp. UBA12306]
MSNSSSSRSLKLKPEYKKQVKASVTRRGFASQTHLATKLGLSRDVISRFLNGKPVDRLNAEEICDKLGWDVQEVTFFQTSINKQPKTDWGEAADSPNSFEREEEFEILDQWIVKDRCPLVLIEGMAGMGKTNLSYQLAKQIANHFDYVIWRSMDQYQSLEELLDDWLSFLYEQQEIEEVKTTEEKLKQLKQKLESDRCLLILSNIHIALKDFSFIDGYQGCEKLLKLIAKKTNKSCLLITSNVTPNTVNQLERNNQLVRRIEIKSLSVKAIQNIFSSVGSFSASDEDWVKLKEIYWGNWFVLKNVAHNIQRNFDSNITNFFEFGDYVFNGIEQFIEEQLDKLSETEKEVMYWVAIYRHPISLFELRDILSGLFNDQLLNIIKYLKSRFFLESIEEGILVQPPMIREYIIKRLINNITEEIVNNNLFWLNRFPLLLTTAQSRIR